MSDKFWYVDRIEGDRAICENDNLETRSFLKSDFSFEIYEGAVIREESGGAFSHDTVKENERREELYRLQQDLFGG